jgi:hypothetical protein
VALKPSSRRNQYRCAIEVNQNGKYCIRLRAAYGRRAWMLPVYFLASSFDRAVKKLAQALQFLQQQEERLWFWGEDRTDDPLFKGEFLAEAGLKLDRRAEFPSKAATVAIPPDRPIPAFLIAPVRRALADSVATAQRLSLAAAASD